MGFWVDIRGVIAQQLARLTLTFAVALSALPATAALAGERDPRPRPNSRIPGSHIVVFERSVDRPGRVTERLESAEGFETDLRYRHTLEGFSAELSLSQVADLRADPRVAFVAPDRTMHTTGTVPLLAGDSAPTGIRRFEAATPTQAHERSSVNVAVLDTGIDFSHPDLNAVHGANCIGSGPAQDDNGHGTHVAGTIGAENDGGGVVGVAPGTRLYSVKSFDSQGTGSISAVICGIDWVTATRTDADPANDISVVNVSSGGGGPPLQSCATTTDPLHRAICTSTAAGVMYVVAAGNSGWDFDFAPNPDSPAVYPEVLTVTGLTDSDGLPGGVGGGPACAPGLQDDRFASYSNYATTGAAQAHTIAAPGTCIRSDWPGGGTLTISGTSMAAPHVAGQVALCIAENGTPGPCAGMSPAQVIQKIRSDAQTYNSTNTGYGFVGDPLRPVSGRYYGYLARVGMPGVSPPAPGPAPAPVPSPSTPGPLQTDTTAPTVLSVSPASGATLVRTSTSIDVSFSEEMNQASAQGAFSLAPAAAGVFSWNGDTMRFTPSSPLAEGTTYTARVSTAASDTVLNRLQSERTWTFETTGGGVITAYPAAVSVERRSGRVRSGSAGQLAANDDLFYQVSSSRSGRSRIASWQGTFAGVTTTLSSLDVTFGVKASRRVKQTLSIWRWSSGTWAQLDSRTVGGSETVIQSLPAGPFGDYVSSVGELRIRVRSKSRASFTTSADMLAVSYGS